MAKKLESPRWIMVCLALAGLLVWLLARISPDGPLPSALDARAHETTPRIVSLMPPLTETLFEIGAGDLVVCRSDYCKFPPEVADLPACGTALTPHHEAIVGRQPTIILANDSDATAREDLRSLARTELLPWLRAEEVIASTRHLGQLTGREHEAEALADAMAEKLMVPVADDAPRVLFAMLSEPGKLDPVVFLRRNSIHGQLLHAAGARNAVARDVHGAPELGLEQVIDLDPDIVLLMGAQEHLSKPHRDRILADWQRISPLTAVQTERIGIVTGPHYYGAGHRLLEAIDEIEQEIGRLWP